MSAAMESPESGYKPGGGRGSERSAVRLEADRMVDELRANPWRWVTLWEMPDRTSAMARRQFLTSTFAKRGFNFYVEQAPNGWKIVARYVPDLDGINRRPRKPADQS